MFLTLFVCFLPVFEGNFNVIIGKPTMSISLLIFGVFLKNQGLNLQHADFSHLLREVCLSTILKNIIAKIRNVDNIIDIERTTG